MSVARAEYRHKSEKHVRPLTESDVVMQTWQIVVKDPAATEARNRNFSIAPCKDLVDAQAKQTSLA